MDRWRVHSCSSESAVHSAQNVVLEELYRVWQTKEPAEEAWILLEADPPQSFDKVEIVNAGSSLVELYGLSEDAEDVDGDFELLMSTQQVMTLKDLTNKSNRSRSFTFCSPQKLSTIAALKRWKLLRIVCRQPFGTSEHKSCIGLSRINFFSCNKEGSESLEIKPSYQSAETSSINNTEHDSKNTEIEAKRRKLPGWKVPSETSKVSEEEHVNALDPNGTKAKKLLASAEDTGDEKRSTSTQVKGRKNDQSNNGVSKDKINNSKPSHGQSGTSSHRGNAGMGISERNDKDSSSSFSMLMDGVVFAISGLVNPERGKLRSQALAMGAEYQADWNPGCTLLVCAFPNTPKFRQVKGDGGTIVSKEWITECFNKKRLVEIDPYLMHSGKPWKKRQPSTSALLNDNLSGQSTESLLKSDNKRKTLSNKKQMNSRVGDKQWDTKLEYNDDEVQSWVAEDFNATMSWLQKQDEKPPIGELEETSFQGIIACLEDAMTCLKENKRIHSLLDVWEFVPRVVKELAAYEDCQKTSNNISNEELLKLAFTFKALYESEFKKMRRSSLEVNEKGKFVSKRSDDDYDSDDTIVMDEDEIDRAESASCH